MQKFDVEATFDCVATSWKVKAEKAKSCLSPKNKRERYNPFLTQVAS